MTPQAYRVEIRNVAGIFAKQALVNAARQCINAYDTSDVQVDGWRITFIPLWRTMTAEDLGI
jgi:hypothetical protein